MAHSIIKFGFFEVMKIFLQEWCSSEGYTSFEPVKIIIVPLSDEGYMGDYKAI